MSIISSLQSFSTQAIAATMSFTFSCCSTSCEAATMMSVSRRQAISHTLWMYPLVLLPSEGGAHLLMISRTV